MLTITRPIALKKSNVSVKQSWSAPVAVDNRLGFEISAYSGAYSGGLAAWSEPIAVDSRLGFEISAYAGSSSTN